MLVGRLPLPSSGRLSLHNPSTCVISSQHSSLTSIICLCPPIQSVLRICTVLIQHLSVLLLYLAHPTLTTLHFSQFLWSHTPSILPSLFSISYSAHFKALHTLHFYCIRITNTPLRSLTPSLLLADYPNILIQSVSSLLSWGLSFSREPNQLLQPHQLYPYFGSLLPDMANMGITNPPNHPLYGKLFVSLLALHGYFPLLQRPEQAHSPPTTDPAVTTSSQLDQTGPTKISPSRPCSAGLEIPTELCARLSMRL